MDFPHHENGNSYCRQAGILIVADHRGDIPWYFSLSYLTLS